MKIFKGVNSFTCEKNNILTVGTFDGVHLGHQKIIKKVIEIKKNKKAQSSLLSFTPHPRMVLYPEDKSIKLLTTNEEKAILFEKMGLDNFIIQKFDENFAKLSAIEYVRDLLVGKLKVHTLVVGYDHRFGRNREGDIKLLKELSDLYEFELFEIPAQIIDDIKISSTKIRNALLAGEIEKANSYLNYKYFITGKVVKGNKIGRKINFPTANIIVKNKFKLVPSTGVYAVFVKIHNKIYKGMLNIGTRPTIRDDKQSIEVNIFDFDDYIYNEDIIIYFVNKIRDEKKFSSLDDLKLQLKIDKNKSLVCLEKEKIF